MIPAVAQYNGVCWEAPMLSLRGCSEQALSNKVAAKRTTCQLHSGIREPKDLGIHLVGHDRHAATGLVCEKADQLEVCSILTASLAHSAGDNQPVTH